MSLPEDIYSQRILELAANMPRAERLPHPDATATAHSKLCGSRVTVDLSMEGDVVTDYGQSVKACLLGQSSAAVMGWEIVGSTAAELRSVGAAMRKMLKAGWQQQRLTVEETAEVLHVSAETVKRDWRLAKLWLLRELKGDVQGSTGDHRA